MPVSHYYPLRIPLELEHSVGGSSGDPQGIWSNVTLALVRWNMKNAKKILCFNLDSVSPPFSWPEMPPLQCGSPCRFPSFSPCPFSLFPPPRGNFLSVSRIWDLAAGRTKEKGGSGGGRPQRDDGQGRPQRPGTWTERRESGTARRRR